MNLDMAASVNTYTSELKSKAMAAANTKFNANYFKVKWWKKC